MYVVLPDLSHHVKGGNRFVLPLDYTSTAVRDGSESPKPAADCVSKNP